MQKARLLLSAITGLTRHLYRLRLEIQVSRATARQSSDDQIAIIFIWSLLSRNFVIIYTDMVFSHIRALPAADDGSVGALMIPLLFRFF